MNTKRNAVRMDSAKTAKRLLAAMVIALAPAAMALEATPNPIEIKTADQSVTIALTDKGAPVPAADISSVKLYVDDHDYDHMITVVKADGSITIRPTEALELGHYDLAIKTSHGEMRVPVTALQGVADEGLEARAKRQGVTVEEIKKQLGISQAVGQDRITLGLSQVYYTGQSLKISMEPKSGRAGTWMVNGVAVVAQGASLNYTFEQPGVYDFAYVEKEGERTVGVGLGTASVVAEPAIPVSVKAGVKQTLLGPEGYGSYAWKLDGAEAGKGSSWTGTFAAPGTHVVTLRAESPRDANAQNFRDLSYAITVQ